MNDLLIIGGGLAGTVLADKAAARGIPVTLVNDPSAPSASAAAYGMLNPVHIRNAVLSWNASLFYPVAKEYFLGASARMGMEIARKTEILHLLSGEDEAVLWRQNTESGPLFGYTNGVAERIPGGILRPSPAGAVRITESLFVDIPSFVKAVAAHLQQVSLPENFDHGQLHYTGQCWNYRGKEYSGVVFCEGIRALQNPYFGELPFRPCKGDVLTVKIPGAPVDAVVHRKIFLIPLGGEMYRAGSTYDWEDISFMPSAAGKQEIMAHLDELLDVPYEVTGQRAGVRPAMADRKPVVGSHPFHCGLFIFNGLGSRGLIQAPFFADQLLDHITESKPVLAAADVQRFRKRLSPERNKS